MKNKLEQISEELQMRLAGQIAVLKYKISERRKAGRKWRESQDHYYRRTYNDYRHEIHWDIDEIKFLRKLAAIANANKSNNTPGSSN